MSVFRKTIGLVAIMCASQVVHAITIVPGAYGTLGYDGLSHAFTGANSTGSPTCGSISVSGGPSPTLTSIGNGCTDDLQAIFIYFFAVNGPAGIVPVNISSSSSASQTGANQAGYSLTVGPSTLIVDNCLVGYSESGCGDKSYNNVLNLQTNTVYGVTMMTIVSRFLGTGTGVSILDPIFSIDSGFANSSAYSFVFSDGIGNGSVEGPVGGPVSVPEPGTLALFGLGLLGAPLVRKRKAALVNKVRA